MARRDTIQLLNDRMQEALDEYDCLRTSRNATQRELDAAWAKIRETERLRSDLYDLHRRNA